MPELPEVETVRRGLAPALVGRRLKRVEQRRPDLRFPLPKDFAARLEGRRIMELSRRAKYLIAALDNGELWTMHLGMSGRFSIIAGKRAKQPGEFYYAEPPDPTHTHIVVETDKGVRVEYNDPRRFGYMDLIPADGLSVHPWFAGMGPEPLGNQFHAAHLTEAFAGKKQSVKATLLDQRIVAGLGNIYVCEALFRAGIDPRRAAGRISPPRLERLTKEIRDVLTEAIEAGGSSLRDYAQADGALGYFQHRFRIYDRERQPCGACGSIVKRIVQAGRSTFFCSRCQR
ncbi:MAG: bifunctional DNA-formamidopyrimidine glycosylase/DNA-(apurinic or apyrimidinic site) lyase [Hyphomonadaceae bacterium]|nr:bifunctional DNA-formamidopyrimidine glycosylase/DNA-(apurinic or apyrimidinic site) lyase [Hyphomonadaceae bacterium]